MDASPSPDPKRQRSSLGRPQTEEALEAAYALRCHVLPRLRPVDVVRVLLSCPGLLGPSCRALLPKGLSVAALDLLASSLLVGDGPTAVALASAQPPLLDCATTAFQ
eukprot:m51a1_g8243 hypothetical protein (107) ;mRNA; r:123794-124423